MADQSYRDAEAKFTNHSLYFKIIHVPFSQTLVNHTHNNHETEEEQYIFAYNIHLCLYVEMAACHILKPIKCHMLAPSCCALPLFTLKRVGQGPRLLGGKSASGQKSSLIQSYFQIL